MFSHLGKPNGWTLPHRVPLLFGLVPARRPSSVVQSAHGRPIFSRHLHHHVAHRSRRGRFAHAFPGRDRTAWRGLALSRSEDLHASPDAHGIYGRLYDLHHLGVDHRGPLGLALDHIMMLLVGLAGGTGTCFMAWAMHRMALMTIGVTVGAVFGNALFAVLYANPPFWAPMAGGAIGLVAFPILFPFFLKVFTSAAGSVVVAWALGYPTNLIAVGGLWGLGMTAQFMFGPPSERPGAAKAPEEPAKKSDDGFRRSYRM